jgi:hypothetical protein
MDTNSQARAAFPSFETYVRAVMPKAAFGSAGNFNMGTRCD